MEGPAPLVREPSSARLYHDLRVVPRYRERPYAFQVLSHLVRQLWPRLAKKRDRIRTSHDAVSASFIIAFSKMIE